MDIAIARSVEELEGYRDAWDDLARHALEPNVFYESWMMIPAVRAFGGGSNLQFLFVTEKTGEGRPVLHGFFPLERRRGYKGLPVRYVRLWNHKYCFFGAPLLRSSHGFAALDSVMHWLAQDPRGAALIEWPWTAGDGPLQHLLLRYVAERGRLFFVSEQFTRGFFRPRADAESFLQAALDARERKDLRRKEKHLAESGPLEYRTLGPGDDAAGWIDAFLSLEATGWKGRAGTAITNRPEDREYFRATTTAAFARGQLLMLGLYLNARPIAMKCIYLTGPGSFAFKIAYDEEHGKSSPGLLLETANIRELHARPSIQWQDCCTDRLPNMFDQIWLERRIVQDVLLSTGRAPGDLLVSALPFLRWLKRGLAGRKGKK